MKKAIGYARISDDDQSRWSIPGQEDIIREHCRKENIDLVAIFSDDGFSAKNFDRADWKKLETFVKENYQQVDYLFVMAWTRFSRNTKEALEMIEKLEELYHIRIVSITEPLHMHPDSPYYHYVRQMIIQNSELEWRLIRDRTRFGLHSAQKAGRYTTKAPAGYINARDDRDDPIIIIDPVKAPLIREAYQRFLNGEGTDAIRRILKVKGMTIAGRSTLQYILQNPLYMGYVKQIAYYDSPETLVKGIHEPLVSEDDWWRVQAIFSQRNKLQKTTVSEDFPLRGVLKCHCDRNFTAAFSRGNGGKIGYYKCNTHTNINLNAKKIHSQFDELLKELSLPALHVKYLQQKVQELLTNDLKQRNSNSDAIRRQVRQLEKKLTNLEDKFINDDVDKAVYMKWKKNYHADRSSLREQLAELSEPIDQVWKRYESSFDRMADLQYFYHIATVEEKQGFVRTVFDNQLRYQDKSYRTTFLLDPFLHKVQVLKEKGLLVYEQPHQKIAEFSESAPGRTKIEPLMKFLALISNIKAA